MDIRNLTKMANQIGGFFEAGGRPDMVTGDIAGHLKRFWDPRMRKELLALVEQNGGTGLRDSVIRAVKENADVMRGAQRPLREEEQFVGPEGGGDAG